MNAGLFRVNNIEKNATADEQAKKSGGAFRVSRGDVFQIRGYDISNMTLIYGLCGWILMDVLTVSEVAAAAWKNLVQKYLKDAPIRCVIYSHSHLDHYGGVGGLKPFFAKNVALYAPEGFTKHAVSENIYVGPVMQRRAMYQFGHLLPVQSDRQIDAGLGKVTAKGHSTLLAPTREIGFGDYKRGKNYAEICVNCVRLQFQLTPDTEAPAEMNVYAPEQKVLFAAENCTGTLHNVLTPRGAQVRDTLAWANYIDQTIVSFPDLTAVCSAHNWPHFGNEDSIRYLELQRDMYRFIHNRTLHLVNLGYTIDEVGRLLSDKIGMPEELQNEWCAHGFYGTANHNAKAVYQRYIGWFDGNPVNLNRNMPTVSATKYVEYMNGYDAIVRKVAEELYLVNPNHAWIAEVLNLIMNADIPEDKTLARNQLARSLRELGYRSEAATWRNMYLSAAEELSGVLPPENYQRFDDDTIHTMSLDRILQLIGIMYDGKEGNPVLESSVMGVQTEGRRPEYASVRIGRGVVHYRTGYGCKREATFTVIGSKVDFFRALAEEDQAAQLRLFTTPESRQYADELLTHLRRFPINFPIMTPRPEYTP